MRDHLFWDVNYFEWSCWFWLANQHTVRTRRGNLGFPHRQRPQVESGIHAQRRKIILTMSVRETIICTYVLMRCSRFHVLYIRHIRLCICADTPGNSILLVMIVLLTNIFSMGQIYIYIYTYIQRCSIFTNHHGNARQEYIASDDFNIWSKTCTKSPRANLNFGVQQTRPLRSAVGSTRCTFLSSL